DKKLMRYGKLEDGAMTFRKSKPMAATGQATEFAIAAE
ncbi:MAG: hypothetical protein RLZZ366_365, partial [Pseudomonadota bacterium]